MVDAVRDGEPPVAPVVVGVEDSPAGAEAVRWGADEAVRRGRPLRLVHALRWPAGANPSPADDRPGVTWSSRFKAPGLAALEEARALAARCDPGLVVDTALVEGSPAAALRREAAGAALVVLGSRRLSSAAELLTTGSVAVPVAAHSPCPVVVVRGPEHTVRRPLTVVAGVDCSRTSMRALDFAFEEAALRGATLLAVAVRRPSGNPLAAVTTPQAVEEERGRLGEALRPGRARWPRVPVVTEVAVGHPVEVLAETAGEALCVVVGSRGYGGFRGMLLGSVGHGLLHHARCPVVVVPGPGHGDG